MSKTDYFIKEYSNFGAKNYSPIPVVLSKGEGAWVWDVEGNKYLDCLSSYSAINQGHSHPKIYKAMCQQAANLPLTSMAFYNDKTGAFLKELCTTVKKEKALLMNTGAEAVETALKATRRWGHNIKGIPEDKAEIIVCKGNFHGRTISIISMSSEESSKKGFGGFTPGFKIIPFGDAKALEGAITKNTAGFLFEPIQGEGGVIIPPNGYLKEVRKICDKHNILMVADEVQTGMGRTGKLLATWHEEVEADMYIFGKALSGGFYPISAIATDSRIMDVFTPGSHGSTFGGNPLAATVGLAAIKVIKEEKLAERAKEMGNYLYEKIKNLNPKKVKEVRAKGLMLGIEFHEDAGHAHDYALELVEKGVLCKDTHDTTLRFAPPLVCGEEEIDFLAKAILEVVS